MALEHMSGESLYKPLPAKITAIKQMTKQERWFEIELQNGRSLGHRPMQFAEVSLFGIGEAPISISSSPTSGPAFELCVRNAGCLTGQMMKLQVGDSLGIRGPLGNGFDPALAAGKDLLIVAGGLGIVPTRSLINYVLDRRSEFGHLNVLYGSRLPTEILYREELALWQERDDIDLGLIVDRPDQLWKGQVGVITKLFAGLKIDPDNTIVVIVGPPVMFKFAIMELFRRSVRSEHIHLSLERRMKCGVGKCGHCQINQLYTCQDGPVFRFDKIRTVKEAL